jgi:hypothetical protein
MTTTTLASITFDCSDAAALARFWGAALGREVPADASADYALLPGEPAWSFMRVPESKAAKNRVHVDLATENLAATVKKLVGLGATKLGDFDEAGYRWTTLADPEGNEFDVVVASG